MAMRGFQEKVDNVTDRQLCARNYGVALDTSHLANSNDPITLSEPGGIFERPEWCFQMSQLQNRAQTEYRKTQIQQRRTEKIA